MVKRVYAVIIRKTHENFSVEVPDFPGCMSTGETVEEAINNIKEIIDLHLEWLKEEGRDIPLPKHTLASLVEHRPEAFYTTVEISAW